MANKSETTAEDIPLPGDVGDLKKALQFRKRLMDRGAIMQAKKWMRQWYKIHRDKDNG